MHASILSEKESIRRIIEFTKGDTIESLGFTVTTPLYLLEVNKQIVGAVEGQCINGSFFIGFLLIREKRKGYGRIFARLLKEKYTFVQGLSLYESVPFWEKVGVQVEPVDYSRYLSKKEMAPLEEINDWVAFAY